MRTREQNQDGVFDSYTPADSDRSVFESAAAVIDAVVALFILMAAIMAGVVMLKLTDIV